MRSTPAHLRANARWQQKNRDKLKGYILKYRFKISMADYNRMFLEQLGVCAICRQPETSISQRSHPPRPRNLAVDHCKITGKIRGLLCKRCNITIGAFDHNPVLLRLAATYLENKK